MNGAEEQTEILRNIWGEMKALNGRVEKMGADLGSRIDQTNSRLDQTNSRLDQTNSRLDEAITRLGRVENGIQTMSEALKDLAAQQLMLGRYIKNVVDRHEQSIDDLKERVIRLEGRLGEPR